MKNQNCWAGMVPIGLVISFPLFINKFVLVGNPTTYWLEYWFSDIGSFVFSIQYKICILMIYKMTIFDQIDFSPLKSNSQRKPRFLNCPLKKVAQTFRRVTQCQKSSNLIYFHNQNQITKQLPRNLGHRPCNIDPTSFLTFSGSIEMKHWALMG